MKKFKVYLKGAYGPGNLGDDVLLICMINILKKHFQPSHIAIGVEDIKRASEIDSTVTWLNYKEPCKADILVYGGGGQFFSFLDGNESADQVDKGILSKVYSFINENKNPVNAITRLAISRLGAIENLVLAKTVASYCIGVGPFETKGKGMDRLRKFIKVVDYCTVRDNTSKSHIVNEGIGGDEVLVYSDPSFDRYNWMPISKPSTADEEGYISYIVRHWPYSPDGKLAIDVMIMHAKSMRSLGHKVRLVSLHPDKDKELIKREEGFEWLLYEVGNMGVEQFLDDLVGGSSLISSARAHGVWLATVLGFPVLSVGIENKLLEVHKSLSSCSEYTEAKSLDMFDTDFKKYEANFKSLSENIEREIEANAHSAKKACFDFSKWLTRMENENKH